MSPARIDAHVPVVPPRIGSTPARPAPELLESLQSASASDASDAVGRLYTMDPAIRPLYSPMRRTVGVALTVKAHPGDNLAIHGGLARAQPGDVLVVDWLGYHGGCGSGAEALLAPAARGLLGVVIDGGWRDVEELQARDFPVFGRSRAAFSPAKREPGEINVPVSCGGVVVEAGDVVIADAEGVVVVPRRHLESVCETLGIGTAAVTTVATEAKRSAERGRYYDEVYAARGGSASS